MYFSLSQKLGNARYVNQNSPNYFQKFIINHLSIKIESHSLCFDYLLWNISNILLSKDFFKY